MAKKDISRRGELLPSRTRQVMPMVEAVSRKRYDVRDGTGSVDNTGRIMRVPLDESIESRHIRCHEMAHVAISPGSPKGPAGLDMRLIQRAEDLRCNTWNRRASHDEEMDTPIADAAAIENLVRVPLFRDGDKIGAGSAAMACLKTGDYPQVIQMIRKIDSEFADRLEPFLEGVSADMERLADEFPTHKGQGFAGGWERTLRNALALRDLCERPPDKDNNHSDDYQPEDQSGDQSEDSASGESGSEGSEPIEGSGEDEDSDGASGAEDGSKGAPTVSDSDPLPDLSEDIPQDDGAFGYEHKEPEPIPEAEDTPADIEAAVKVMLGRGKTFNLGWDRSPLKVEDDPKAQKQIVPMETEEPPRPLRLPGQLVGRAQKPAETGMVPRYIHRYASDKTVFAERGQRPGGGTVLVDCSGSMGFEPEHVEEILALAPAATIAQYSGRGYSGTLTIVAKGGRRIRASDFRFDGGNVVDVPAIEWLCEQPAPRYWVCDGMVTGESDNALRRAWYEYLAALCRRYQILRLGSIELLEERIQGGQRRRRIRRRMIGTDSRR